MSPPFYLKLIDTKTTGGRYDVTPLFSRGSALAALCEDLLGGFDAIPYDVIAGIDALGFILGAAMAARTGRGFVAVRKGGKLPIESPDRRVFVDYTGEEKSLELRPKALRPGMRVLLVDEWIETGAQVTAAIELLEGQGASVVGIATICMDDNPKTRAIKDRVHCVSVWPRDDGHQFA